MHIKNYPQLSVTSYSKGETYYVGDIIEEITSKRKFIISMIPETHNSYLYVGALPLEGIREGRNERDSFGTLLKVSAIRKYTPTYKEQEAYLRDMIDDSLDLRDEQAFLFYQSQLEELNHARK